MLESFFWIPDRDVSRNKTTIEFEFRSRQIPALWHGVVKLQHCRKRKWELNLTSAEKRALKKLKLNDSSEQFPPTEIASSDALKSGKVLGIWRNNKKQRKVMTIICTRDSYDPHPTCASDSSQRQNAQKSIELRSVRKSRDASLSTLQWETLEGQIMLRWIDEWFE